MADVRPKRQHCRMEDHDDRIGASRTWSDYCWMVFCAALLISVVVYAVVTAT